MRKIRTFYYILRQGMANSFKNWHMLFSSIFVIFVSLYIMGCLVMVFVNLQRILTDLSEQQKEVLIDCSTEISDAASYSIADVIVSDSRVDKVDRISKEENLKNAIEMFEEEQDLFEDFDSDYMYVSFRVQLKSVKNVQQFSEDMKKVPGIEEVTDNTSVYKYFSSLNKGVRIGSIVAVIVFGFLSVLLSANTIRLTVFARNKELFIMKNIGASKAYMRGPFVVEGIIIGIISATISYFALRVTYAYLYKLVEKKSEDLRNILGLAEFSEFSVCVFFMFLAAGIIVGVVSGVIAVRRYVKI
ncbi:MAG: permease-like cell division protein FtsX [Clostridia bacterium]|nr:permease-like cell division protein FtsX [Clostridia bacterium]